MRENVTRIKKVEGHKNFIQAIFGGKIRNGGKVCGKVGGKVGGKVVGKVCGKVVEGGVVVDKSGFYTKNTRRIRNDFHTIFGKFISVKMEFSKFYTGLITINIKYII